MAKNPTKKSTAATEAVSSDRQQDDAATVPPVTETASSPAGSQMPAGDNTQRESDDAAGKTSVEPVKPQAGDTPTEAVTAEAATLSQSAGMSPEAEASASGVSDPSQGDAAGSGANAAPSAGLSSQAAAQIVSKVLGIDAPVERRVFVACKQVRHNGELCERGGKLTLTRKEHAKLSRRVVSDWEFGLEVRDAE